MEYWVFWLVLGVALCVAELFFPTAFFELAMGISAITVSLVTRLLPSFLHQSGLWLILSIVFVLLTRRFIRPRQTQKFEDAKEGLTLTPILPGQTGRVLYEGNSWQASCEDPGLEILPHQKVVVVRRVGTTLIVMPG